MLSRDISKDLFLMLLLIIDVEIKERKEIEYARAGICMKKILLESRKNHFMSLFGHIFVC